MSEKKLYRVSVEFDFYAYAEDDYEARELAQDAVDGMIASDCAIAIEVKAGEPTLHDWSPYDLVYHNGGEDIELGEVLDGPARSR